ncbi:uncharacterized protein LOC144791348 [Lissotriton helveticus]
MMDRWVFGGVQLLLAFVCVGNAVPSTPVSVVDQAAMCQEVLSSSPTPMSVPWSCLCYSCKGTQGIPGSKGAPGAAGSAGSPGMRGAKGSPGAAGLQGVQGPRGYKGAAGNPGDQGPPGNVGMKGNPGDKGDKGDSGNDGLPGTMGPPGLQGVCPPCTGQKGAPGANGPAGAPGTPGNNGLPGVNGTNGSKGDKGDVGSPGVGGPPGAKGDLGPQGICNCVNGAPGPAGAVGPQGPQGLVGAVGPKGSAGAKGDQGLQGDKGSQGDQGYQGIPGPCTAPVQSSFSAMLTVSYPKSTLPIPFTKILHNPQNHFDAVNSIYIVPTNGTYLLSFQLSVYGRVLVVGLFRNGKLVSRAAQDANRGVCSQTLVMRLSAGDTIWLQTKNDQSNGVYFDTNSDSTFTGYLIYPDVCDGSLTRSFASPSIPTTFHGFPVEPENLFIPPTASPSG